MSEQKILIIGGAVSGPKAAARARRLDPNAEIIIIEKDSYISYNGCGLPFYISDAFTDFEQLFTTSYGSKRDEQYFLGEKNVKVLTRHEAVKVDRSKKEVLVKNLDDDKNTAFSYDKLVIATGSTPFIPPIEGIGLNNVFRLNHPEDAGKIKAAIGNVKKAVVIGAGLIGMEAADALCEKGISACVVELKDQILPGVLDKDMANLLKARLEEQGMEFRIGLKVQRIEGDEAGNVVAVITDSGRLPAEMVVMAVGVIPNVGLARDAGLKMGKRGIEVNQHMQTSDPDIYAVGDCIENLNQISGQKEFVPLASTGNRQGRVAGDNVVGGNSIFKGIQGTTAIKVLNWNAGKTGLGQQKAEELGYEVITAVSTSYDCTHYHPAHKAIIIKMIADKKTKKILGAQFVGPGDGVKRIDVLATAIYFGGTVDDIHNIDLSYAPPFSTPIDPVQHTANMIRNKMDNMAVSISVEEVKAKFDSDEDFIMVDIRTPLQYKTKHIDDPRVKLIPLVELRERLAELPRDKEIIVLCSAGIRSYEAMRTLSGAGFQDIKHIEGGIQFWPYKVVAEN